MEKNKSLERIKLPLHKAVDLVLSNAELRLKGLEYNLFYIIDKPGAGKTRTIERSVNERGWGFLSYSPALERVEKFGGIPDIFWADGESQMHVAEKKELRTVWSIPQMITEINDCAKKYPIVIVLLDDWHLCDEDIQRIGFELFTYYKLNNNPISKNVVFVLAGNETSAAGARIQLSAIRNRSTIIYTCSDVQNWIDNFAIPNCILPIGISFFRSKIYEYLFQEEESAHEQFGSPRSWTSAFNLISELERNEQLKNDPYYRDFVFCIIQGSVSREATEKFMLHYDIYSKLNIEEILNTGVIKLPKDTIELYCYITGLTYFFFEHYYTETLEDKEKNRIMKIYGTFIEELVKVNNEMTVTSLVTLANLSKGKEKNGMLVLQQLIKSSYISIELSKKLMTTTSILSTVK